jgi:hypothetical protein
MDMLNNIDNLNMVMTKPQNQFEAGRAGLTLEQVQFMYSFIHNFHLAKFETSSRVSYLF